MTNVTALFAKVAGVALLAGAMALMAPQKADAQVRFGVAIGIPVHGGPVYGRPVYGAPLVYASPARYYAPAPVYGGRFSEYYGRRHEWTRDHGYWRADRGYYR
jgi:hypothetical protein